MKFKLFVGLVALASLISFGLFAAGTPATTGVKDINVSIADKTGLTVDKYTELTKSLSLGQIMILSELAKESKQPVDTILAEKNSGKEWKQIAETYKLHFEMIRTNSEKNIASLEKEYKGNNELKQAMSEIKSLRTKTEKRVEHKMKTENPKTETQTQEQPAGK